MGDVESTAVAGNEWRGYRRGSTSGDGVDQYVIPTKDRITTYKGRCTSFVTAGRGAASQRLMAIHNATGSTVLVSVNRVRVDVLSTVAKAVTVIPPTIRVHRFTAIPTNGTSLTTSKVPLDTALTSNASVTLWGDSSADNSGAGTPSGTTLTVTLPSGSALAHAWGPRVITAAGYEPIDTVTFFEGETDITLRALEGLCITLDNATASTGNATTDRWLATMDWEEFQRP
jgi:hypothetical protein